jgi:hypothetical protein
MRKYIGTEHDFPEQEEQQEVERHERAQHAGLQQEHEDVVLLHPLRDRGPRRQHRDEPHHRRQENEQDAQAVDAEEVIGADRRNPRGALDELIGGPCGLNQNHSGIEMKNPTSAVRFAIQRIAFSLCLLTSRISSAPTSGSNRMIDSR